MYLMNYLLTDIFQSTIIKESQGSTVSRSLIIVKMRVEDLNRACLVLDIDGTTIGGLIILKDTVCDCMSSSLAWNLNRLREK